MSTISHDPSRTAPEKWSWPARLLVRDMWAAMAIAFIWLAALFALFATRGVAKYGFGHQEKDPD